jgi:nitrite reductase (NO-forming)
VIQSGKRDAFFGARERVGGAMSSSIDLMAPGRARSRFKGPLVVWGNVLVLGWLAVAVALLATHERLGLPGWVAVHAFLLGCVTNAIVVWSEHFVVALCRAPAPPEQRMRLGLTGLNLAVVLVLVGVVVDAHWLSGTGATVVTVIAVMHTVHLVRIRRAALPGRFDYLIGYYAAASVALAVGAVLGGALTAGGLDWYAQLWGAHVHVTLLGWLGLSVLGTIVTLGPTALHTRIPDGASQRARRSLWLLVTGLAATAAGSLIGNVWVTVAGLLAYAGGAGTTLVPFGTALLRLVPWRSAPWQLAIALCWLLGALSTEAGVLLAERSLDGVSAAVDRVLPMLVIGFGAQVLAGSLTQLLPVVLGRGPAEHKRISGVLETAWLPRVITVNAAVVLILTGLPVWGWTLAAVGFGVFVVLALSVALPVAAHGALPATLSGTTPGLAVGLVAVLAAVGFAVSGADERAGNGTVRTVDIELRDMRITPSTVEVEEGTRVRLRVTNTDAAPHDLRLANGTRTDRLATGDTEILDAGVIISEVSGWCTVAGHRMAGMTMTINTTTTAHDPSPGGHGSQSTAEDAPTAGWEPWNAVLPPASAATVHRVELRVTEHEVEVAPGVRQRRWTFGGTAPGPVLRGKVGDRFEITLVNDGTLGHSIDFHAGALAPDKPMRTIEPGERLVYHFTAQRAGAWLYHCSTAPMSLHIANGMYGAVIIDPPDLPPANREYVLVGGQYFAGEPGSDDQTTKIAEGRPDGWQFNGMTAQYDHAHLTAKVGERIRFWVVNAGPGDQLSFHVVGGQFDTVYKEGAWTLPPGTAGGAQALDLAPAQGGFTEMVFGEPGRYPFVDHDMRHAEHGAHGLIEVTS